MLKNSVRVAFRGLFSMVLVLCVLAIGKYASGYLLAFLYDSPFLKQVPYAIAASKSITFGAAFCVIAVIYKQVPLLVGNAILILLIALLTLAMFSATQFWDETTRVALNWGHVCGAVGGVAIGLWSQRWIQKRPVIE